MTRRPLGPGRRSGQEECRDTGESRIEEVSDPDPTVNFPQWSRSLLLLLDYAIIEGLQHRLHAFVHHLKLAEAELTKAASDSVAREEAKSDEEAPSPPKVH
ncbi:hypothetical protein [Methyloceanibacter methanicus]|uniref:hypothetical protein n=1 Tax=Methyloceanibacter methanicus TaxID=1774968 RepID=UPI00114D3782|nr:hypothetical protein [Methyloceanibacter methanicus]